MWELVGVAFLAWAAYDLFAGATFFPRRIARAEEPGLYWAFILLWTSVGLLALLLG